MAENPRPPVAIRIVRPYETEDQLLENELETIGKSNVILIGAHPRPTGVILRFEVTLSSGATVLRGEGRVLAHKENAFRGQAGLSLRFTRLDPRSKAVVDRATAMREAKGPSRPPAAPASDPAIADALTASTPEPVIAASHVPEPPSAPATPVPAPQLTHLPPQPPAVITAADEARARARAVANATARRNAMRTKPSGEPLGLTPPPIPTALDSAGSIDVDVDVDMNNEVESSPTPVPTPVTSIPGEVEINVQPARMRDDAPDDFDQAVTLPPRAPAQDTVRPESVMTTRPDDALADAEPLRIIPPAAPAPRVAAPAVTPVPGGTARKVDPPSDKAELLARLRDRAGKLAPERVSEILGARR